MGVGSWTGSVTIYGGGAGELSSYDAIAGTCCPRTGMPGCSIVSADWRLLLCFGGFRNEWF